MWPAKRKPRRRRVRRERMPSVRPAARRPPSSRPSGEDEGSRAKRTPQGQETTEMIRSRGGRRSDPCARFEKNEPRVDAHTPSRAYALSDEAAARIRRKVEAALAARAAKADGKAAPQQEKKGRGHGGRSARKPAPQQNKTAQSKTAQSKTTNHRRHRSPAEYPTIASTRSRDSDRDKPEPYPAVPD